MKKRIAFVVQRYGIEVNGGSEYSCRLFAEKLNNDYEIEVLTTKAVDYITWENQYSEDLEYINGVKVRRFNIDYPRNIKSFDKFTRKIITDKNRTKSSEIDWMKMQGPVSEDLINYIKLNSINYDGFIFFTYLYYPTFFGLQLVSDKSILIPTAHDEPFIYFSIFRELFHSPKAILFLTEEERKFVHSYFLNEYIHNEVVGVGIELANSFPSEQEFRAKYKLQGDFLIYVGRIDESKGCDELFRYFQKYIQKNIELKLVLIGKTNMVIPENSNIIHLGFVSEEDKLAAISSSKLLLMPSKFESFSIALLEGMHLNKPVLVNGLCDVLVSHCKRGNAGLYYENYEEFEYCLSVLLSNENLADSLGINGHEYVKSNYSWDIIVNKFKRIIEQVM